MPKLRMIRLAIGLLAAGAIFTPPAAAAGRALVIGVDDYAHVPKLRGAVADARDIAQALRATGVAHIRVLTDREARRDVVIDAFEKLVSGAQRGETVFIAIAGMGAAEPERFKGSQADGLDPVFLLQAFDPRDPGLASEKIVEAEFNHYIRRIEAAGGRAVFVADTCFGGELARPVDPRAGAIAYRCMSYAPVGDAMRVVAGHDDAFAARASFARSFVLAAVDKPLRAPELNIPGVGPRGALSYAFARAIEGSAGDGRLGMNAIFPYVRQVVHQLSDQRQVVELSPRDASEREPVVTRGVAAPDGSGSARPAPPPDASRSAKRAAPLVVTLAALDGRNDPLTDLPKLVSVALVAPSDDPDLVWDPVTRDVLAGPDIIARDISVSELAGVVERTVLLKALKRAAALHVQDIRLLPGDDLHRKGSRVEVEIGQLSGRYLLLFDLAGAGAAQLLYPLGSDPPRRDDGQYSVSLSVREPYGADLIVAISANQRLDELERLVKRSGRRLNASRFLELLSQAERQDLRIGYVGLFTSP
ncbi:hypothetical protein M2323_003790 [Rhodoblastus acidophilus]|uniref:caspase family protein n=1 Tax=Rhodoblastus acidophilus TaxID=1074 RepID=UPI0022257283|nr:caspase family protein [Rhodoblastus acidophilus]MCW2285953.1 hypothetical protein [Rhodoblastus acidophilus]MCW2334847.1 hypothetical protein [Rhodoblastus acidophilus]